MSSFKIRMQIGENEKTGILIWLNGLQHNWNQIENLTLEFQQAMTQTRREEK